MWVLFVLSFVPEFNYYKVTEFNRYTTNQQCEINKAVLETLFENNEVAACVESA